MREGVLIVVADCRQSDQRGLLVQHLIDDSLHHSLDFADVGRLANADRVDDVLGDRYRLGIGAIGSSLRLLVEFFITIGLSRRLQLERFDLRVLEAREYLLETIRRRILGFAAKQREQQAPIAGRSLHADLNGADPGELHQRQDVAERRVVAEIETQAGLIQEDEFAGDSELELAFFGAQLLGDLRELRQRLLHGAVFERIELDRSQRGVKCDHEVSAAAAEGGARLLLFCRSRLRSWRAHAAAPPRIALLTAFLTITSFSPAALFNAAVALGELIFPSAMAAHARISESSFFPMNPLEFSSPSSRVTPASPHKRPYASKNAIFSPRLLSRRSRPLIATSILGSAARAFLAPSVRTATMRTSRSSSATARSIICSAPDDPMSARAVTAARRMSASPTVSILPRAGTAAGDLSAAARRIASRTTASSSSPIRRINSALLLPASRPAPASSNILS